MIRYMQKYVLYRNVIFTFIINKYRRKSVIILKLFSSLFYLFTLKFETAYSTIVYKVLSLFGVFCLIINKKNAVKSRDCRSLQC